jgi:hypothetical protein
MGNAINIPYHLLEQQFRCYYRPYESKNCECGVATYGIKSVQNLTKVLQQLCSYKMRRDGYCGKSLWVLFGCITDAHKQTIMANGVIITPHEFEHWPRCYQRL